MDQYELEKLLNESDDDSEKIFGDFTRDELVGQVRLKDRLIIQHPDSVKMQAPFLNSDQKYNRRNIQRHRVKEFYHKGWKIVPKEQIEEEKKIANANFSDLYEKHKGGKIFILGCGTSMTVDKAKALEESGAVTIGVNEIYRANDPESEWVSFRPTYYLYLDTPFGHLKRHQLEVLHNKGTVVFSPKPGKNEETIGFGRHFKMSNVWDFRSSFNLSEDLTFGHGKTSIFLALQLAVMLGARSIVLVGVDFRVPKKGRWHFYPDREKLDTKVKKDNYETKHFPAFANKFKEIIPPLMKDLGIMVFQTNKKSRLNCFIPINFKDMV